MSKVCALPDVALVQAQLLLGFGFVMIAWDSDALQKNGDSLKNLS